MNTQRSTLGVLIPTRNAAAWLPEHLASLQEWISLADEVAVVDSRSTDGTPACLRQNLSHPHLRFFDRPPGLYQAWNFGIRQLTSDYTYISTVGDTITREGLSELRAVADALVCDVVVSKPQFVDAHGRPLPPDTWPIDDILETCTSQEPLALQGAQLFLFALVNCSGALLGSSASNLYRTECLKQRPFPTEFGTVGDGAWAIRHAFDIRLGVTRKQFSTFRHHPKSYSLKEYAVPDLTRKLFDLAVETFLQRQLNNPDLRQLAQSLDLDAVIAAVDNHLAQQRRLELARRQPWPWILNPWAWAARRKRSRQFARMHQLKREALNRLPAPCQTSA